MTLPRRQADRSFDEFVIEHGPTLLRVARRQASARRLPNSAAEDICSEALFRAWTRWKSIERDRAFGWVCVAEYYIAAEFARDREHSFRSNAEIDFSQCEGNDPEPSEVVCAHEVLRLVAEVLNKVPEQQRIIFMLARSGLSRKEIAAQVGMPPGRVRVQLFRVTEKIRTALRRSEIKDSGLIIPEGSVM